MDAADLGDSEIVVQRGTYKLGGTPIVKNAYCTLRGETGNPADVVIDAEGLSYSRALSEPQV